MKCVILAAGEGSRLRTKGESKPLVRLLGLSLIERVIATVCTAGLRDFCIVTGHKRERVEAFLAGLCRRRDITVSTVFTEEWRNGNGLSVLAAKDTIGDGQFVLLMADHVFDEGILIDLLASPPGPDEVVLAVDYGIEEPRVDAADATKVFAEEGLARDIGKSIDPYNAYDTGMFYCTSTIFGALETAIEQGRTALADGVRVLAQRRSLRVFDIERRHWLDVDTPRDYQTAKRWLRSQLVKPDDGQISVWINRKLSLYFFTPLLLKLFKNVSANQVSVLSFLMGVGGGVFLGLRRAVIGALLVQLASILDGSDGEIARLKKAMSPFGGFIDAVLDRYVDSIIILGLLAYSLSSPGLQDLFGGMWTQATVLLGGATAAAIVGTLMVSYTSAKSVLDLGYRYTGALIAVGRGRDLRLFLVFMGGLLAPVHPLVVPATLVLLSVLSNTIVLRRVWLSWSDQRIHRRLNWGAVRAVLFDFDGTLGDTMPFLTDLAVNLITENYSVSKEKATRSYLETTGTDFTSQLEQMFPNRADNLRVAELFEERKEQGIFGRPLFDDVVPALKVLQEVNVKAFVCSSTREELVRHFLEEHCIEGLLSGTYGYRPGFTKGDQLAFLLEELSLCPDEVIFIGDSLKDCDFARERGIPFVGVTRIFSRRDFAAIYAYSVANLREVARCFQRSRRVTRHVVG